MIEELAQHQGRHELITMAQRGHGFDSKMDDPLVRDAFSKVIAFLDIHTKNERA